jgi:Zn-dependent metalloprotease
VGGTRFHRLKELTDQKPISVTTVSGRSDRFQMVIDDESSLRVLTWSFLNGNVVQTNDMAHWDEGALAKGAAVDAHAYTRKGLAFLRAFPRDFADHTAPNGTQREYVFPLHLDVYANVHENTPRNSNGANAYAIHAGGLDTIHFGDGDSRTMAWSAAYDIVVHELTHLVTAHTSNLVYAEESGALNESFSDAMAAAAEHARSSNELDANNFQVGEDLFLPNAAGLHALRNMANPKAHLDPDHVDEQLRCPEGRDKAYDSCYVHSNSGIPNRAFSLIVAGGSLTKFVNNEPQGLRPIGVSRGLGWEQAADITYWATTGLSKDATFVNAALAQTAEANALGLEAARVVGCAWKAVGVLPLPPEGEAFIGATLCPLPASPAQPDAPGPTSDNLCAGHGDALICDHANPSSAVLCASGARAIPDQIEVCADQSQQCRQVSASDPTAVVDALGALVCD